MMTSSNGKIFRVTGPLCGDFPGHPLIPLTKTIDEKLWFFSLICAWIHGWVNNSDADDLRRHNAHYDVTLMFFFVVYNNSSNGCVCYDVTHNGFYTDYGLYMRFYSGYGLYIGFYSDYGLYSSCVDNRFYCYDMMLELPTCQNISGLKKMNKPESSCRCVMPLKTDHHAPVVVRCNKCHGNGPRQVWRAGELSSRWVCTLSALHKSTW